MATTISCSSRRAIYPSLLNRMVYQVGSPWILEGKTRSNDLNLLLQKIKELIKVGFNNKTDQAKGIYKVKGTYWLGQTINISALFENYRLMLKEWERAKILKIGDNVYNLNDIMTDKVTNRIHRNLTKQYKSSGFLQVRYQTLEKMAYKPLPHNLSLLRSDYSSRSPRARNR